MAVIVRRERVRAGRPCVLAASVDPAIEAHKRSVCARFAAAESIGDLPQLRAGLVPMLENNSSATLVSARRELDVGERRGRASAAGRAGSQERHEDCS